MADGITRSSGIEAVGELAWGTHFCQFYRTRQDLLDTLVPYFAAGLAANEFCVWVTSEPLAAAAAREELGRALPGCGDYFDRGQIEIHDGRDWYHSRGALDTPGALDKWVTKEREALDRGFDGLRLTGNTCWLEREDWQTFMDYERSVNDSFGRFRIVGLCTYSLDCCGAAEVLDVVRTHQFALARRAGDWEVIESAALKLAKSDLNRANARLRALAGELARAEQRERRRISLVLHDELQQTLVAAKMRLERLTSRVGGAPEVEEATEIVGVLEGAVAECRTLAHHLSVPAHYDLDLPAAISSVARRFGEQHRVGVALEMNGDGVPGDDEDLRAVLFEVLRELMLNAVKHGGADRVEVSVELGPDVRLCVRDDGRGCDPATAGSAGGMGLLRVRERVEHLGGRFELRSAPGEGCRVAVSLPSAST